MVYALTRYDDVDCTTQITHSRQRIVSHNLIDLQPGWVYHHQSSDSVDMCSTKLRPLYVPAPPRRVKLMKLNEASGGIRPRCSVWSCSRFAKKSCVGRCSSKIIAPDY